MLLVNLVILLVARALVTVLEAVPCLVELGACASLPCGGLSIASRRCFVVAAVFHHYFCLDGVLVILVFLGCVCEECG